MKVLLLGATGNVGSHLVPALLTHRHHVVAFVRSSSKLESLLPASVLGQITVVQGDVLDSTAVKRAILDHDCDAVVNAAGQAALAPWGKSNLPEIFSAALDAIRQAGEERKAPLRAWVLGGQGVLYYPETKSALSNYAPIFLQHGQNLRLLMSLPPNAVDWSMLCPQMMTSESSSFEVPAKSAHGNLVANGWSPPLWRDSWMKHLPLIGRFMVVGMNASRYATTLEQNADFIASDLESRESRWIGMPVGVIDASK